VTVGAGLLSPVKGLSCPLGLKQVFVASRKASVSSLPFFVLKRVESERSHAIGGGRTVGGRKQGESGESWMTREAVAGLHHS
jgi:hypothetical protein